MDAQGAVDSLVGRLATILVDEAKLLGGLRDDVEFIKEEMESMNSLLLHLTESQHRAHHVRTWMRHVVGLTRDCEGNVELYVNYVAGADPHGAARGRLARAARRLRTVWARHRVATRIRELKVRAHDVGSRRLRYGVTVPSDHAAAHLLLQDGAPAAAPWAASSGGEEEDARRRALLPADGEPSHDEETVISDRLIRWLSAEHAPFSAAAAGEPRVFAILWEGRGYFSETDKDLAARIAGRVRQHTTEVFDCMATVCVKWRYDQARFLREILKQVAPRPAGEEDALRDEAAEQSTAMAMAPRGGDHIGREDEAAQLAEKLQGYLRGKRFLIVLENVRQDLPWDSIRSALLHADEDDGGRPPGCAIILTTPNEKVAQSSSPCEIFRAKSLQGFLYSKAEALLVGCNYRTTDMENIRKILGQRHPDSFVMKMLTHLLYVNPDRIRKELHSFAGILSDPRRYKRVAKQMVSFSYNDLPSKYRSCLLYLAVFPSNDRIRRSTMCRRWIAEGLLAKKDRTASTMDRSENHAQDEADCCFDALVAWGFVHPGETGAAGKIKSCIVLSVVHQVITRIAIDVNFVDTDLPLHLARYLSIHNRIGLQASRSNHPLQSDDNDIVALLPDLAKSPEWQLLKVLDLEGCRGLKKKHLKKICKILLLKYLSLRNTDITELPKKINRLRCLETLDIRQTAIRQFATKSIMLPMLKHLLAGQTRTPSNNSNRFQESFATVRLPSGIGRMKKLEILCHVKISDNVDDLIDIGQLLQLKKLGVILHGNVLGLLFRQITKLHSCLRSLSIQIDQPTRDDGPDADEVVAIVSPPELLQSLNISGITSGLLHWIAELDQLTKITLSETDMGEDFLHILGKLRILRCLRLRHRSYTRSELRFKVEEFESLKSLVVEDSHITNISFDAGAAPILETIVWSFISMESLSGVNHLPKLKKIEFNGDCNPDPVRQAIKEHPSRPVFKHNPRHQCHEAGTVVAASTP